MPGPRGPRGPKPKIKNPGKLFARLMGFIFKKYLPACIIVVICIFVSVLANVQGTMFTKNLIDDYIVPLLKTGNPDYGPLLAAMGRVAVFYGIGVISTFAYSKIMIYVSQGTIKNLRVELFSHMQDLPIRYFDSHAHGDIMSIYTNDIDTLRQLISQSLPQILNSAITVVSCFCFNGHIKYSAHHTNYRDGNRNNSRDKEICRLLQPLFSCTAARPRQG